MCRKCADKWEEEREGRSSVCDLLPFTASCMRVTLPGTDVCGALGL